MPTRSIRWPSSPPRSAEPHNKKNKPPESSLRGLETVEKPLRWVFLDSLAPACGPVSPNFCENLAGYGVFSRRMSVKKHPIRKSLRFRRLFRQAEAPGALLRGLFRFLKFLLFTARTARRGAAPRKTGFAGAPFDSIDFRQVNCRKSGRRHAPPGGCAPLFRFLNIYSTNCTARSTSMKSSVSMRMVRSPTSWKPG